MITLGKTRVPPSCSEYPPQSVTVALTRTSTELNTLTLLVLANGPTRSCRVGSANRRPVGDFCVSSPQPHVQNVSLPNCWTVRARRLIEYCARSLTHTSLSIETGNGTQPRPGCVHIANTTSTHRFSVISPTQRQFSLRCPPKRLSTTTRFSRDQRRILRRRTSRMQFLTQCFSQSVRASLVRGFAPKALIGSAMDFYDAAVR